MVIGHRDVFGEMSFFVFSSLLNRVVFLLLNCVSCVYIFQIKPSLVASFVDIFSQFVRLSFHFACGSLCFVETYKRD